MARALLLCAFIGIFAFTQTVGSLANQMDRLRVHTALLFPTQAIDEIPVWSPDGRYLAANVAGKWLKIDTQGLRLKPAKWHDRRIAVVEQPTFIDVLPAEVQNWVKGVEEQDSVVSGSGVKVALPQQELSRSLVLSKGKVRKTLWRTGMENCEALSLAPDRRHVAFLCELNGVFVMDIDKAFGDN